MNSGLRLPRPNPQVIWEQGGGTNAFSIYTYDDQLYACIAESNAQRGFANVTIATGTVYHIGVSVDLTLASDNIKLYLNGTLVATATTSCGTDLASHSGNVAIAGDDQGNRQHTNGSLTGHFDGRIQDVCHWFEVALTGSDFANIYAAGIGNSGDTSDGLTSGELWTVQQAAGRGFSEGLNVSGQLVDVAGDPILKAGLVAFLVTLFDEATETVINDVDQQDRLAQVEADGSFTLKLNGEDNVIVDLAGVGSGQVEKHVLAMYWLWNDGSRDRSGIQLVRFRVQRLGVRVFPALP